VLKCGGVMEGQPIYNQETEKSAWVAGVDTSDRILKETIREAIDQLSEKDFMVWLRGFIA